MTPDDTNHGRIDGPTGSPHAYPPLRGEPLTIATGWDMTGGGTALTPARRTCPTHGPQGDEAITIRLTGRLEYYCLACFAGWVRAHCLPLSVLP